MTAVERLKAKIFDDGIIAISGTTFIEYTNPKGYLKTVDCTVEEYCEYMASEAGASVDDYAQELLAIISCTDGESIVKECPKCFCFLTEATVDTHTCDGKGRVDISLEESWQHLT